MSAHIDHLAVAALSLDEGVAWAERVLGVTPPGGGAHPRMGTHNRLLRLGDGCYLEIIAVDPAAAPPYRPRWFALDNPEMHGRLASGPQLVTWIARTDAIEMAAARSPIPLGRIEAMSRGDLEWRITIPADGSLPEGGTMPTVIQWPDDRSHPSSCMPDLGCRLLSLDLGHPHPHRLDAAIDAIGLDRSNGLVSVSGSPDGPWLRARLETPSGVVTLGKATA